MADSWQLYDNSKVQRLVPIASKMKQTTRDSESIDMARFGWSVR